MKKQKYLNNTVGYIRHNLLAINVINGIVCTVGRRCGCRLGNSNFYRRNRNFSVRKEWANAFQWVAKAVPCWSPEHIRDFLDSRCGRHLADEACECGGIANVNPERWMNEFLGFGDENDLGQLMAAFRCKVYAQKALKEAEINLRKAENFLNEFLTNLPKANSGCAYDNGMIEYANGKLEMIKVYFGE